MDNVKQQEKEEGKEITITGVEEEEEEVVAVDWLELPDHISSLILNKLSCITDFARFGDVCLKWRSILYQQDFTKLLPRQLPLLMIPTAQNNNKKKKKNKNKNKKKKKQNDTTDPCSFYRVTDGKIFNRLQLAMPRDRYVRGCAHGWLVTVDQDHMCGSVQLMNPFFYPNTSTKEIKLPPLSAHPSIKNATEYHYIYIGKAVLSADPVSNPKDCIVMAISTDQTSLSFCKPGDKVWTTIIDNMRGCFEDVIYYEGKFYAVHYQGTVVVCDIQNRTTTTYARPPVTNFICNKMYIVVSGGELFQVQRHVYKEIDWISCRFKVATDGFKVFKLRKGEPDTDWVETKDIDNHAFFIGDNASMSISVADFPGCKPNCIYYTHDCLESYLDQPEDGPTDLGVFNLQDGSFDKHYPTDASIQLLPAPIWIEPTLPRLITRSKCNITTIH